MPNENLIVSIVLPAALSLQDGSILGQEVTFEVAGSLFPFYASIDQIRLHGGMYLNKLSDLTIAGMIYSVSKEARSLSYTEPDPVLDETSPAWKCWNLFNVSRNRWVTARAVRDLILNIYSLVAGRGQKTLANFSVGRQDIIRDQGIPGKLAELNKVIHDTTIVLNSGGKVGPGGHVKPTMAAKGLNDGSDGIPGRLWITTGMGADAKTIGVATTQGVVKPVKYRSGPIVVMHIGTIFSPTVILPVT